MILEGDCRETLKTLAAESVSSIVTDPPYEIGFMGKGWDGSGVANDPTLWAECYRVLKPGGHVLAFGAARTYHRMACAIENAGFEIRDSLHWVYGSGFPKSHNVSKGIDRAAGAEREVLGVNKNGARSIYANVSGKTLNPLLDITTAATDDAKRWEGWGTALKPAHEPIVMARKPFPGTVAQNVLEHGTGALNIDATRISMGNEYDPTKVQRTQNSGGGVADAFGASGLIGTDIPTYSDKGRWPANVILTHSTECGSECAPDCPALEIDRQSGQTKSTQGRPGGDGNSATTYGAYSIRPPQPNAGHADTGGASRFYAQPEWSPGDYLASIYTPKAGKRERNAGLDGMPERKAGSMSGGAETREGKPTNHPIRANHHPTVKPVALMRYLIRLVTSPGGLVLDPFLGSGTTAVAAILEGFNWIGCELTAEYLPIIEARTLHAARDYPAVNTIQNPDNSTQSQLGLFEEQAL